MRDFTRLTNFLNSVEFQAIKSEQAGMSDEDFVLAARGIWDAQINAPDVPVPGEADWPEETMEGTAAEWDEGQYTVNLTRGNIILRDNLIDLNIPLPYNTLTDEPFLFTIGVEDYDHYVLSGIPYDDELFIATVS